MAVLHVKTPNGETAELDLSKIEFGNGTFTIHSKDGSNDYTLNGSSADGNLRWSGNYIVCGNYCRMASSQNEDAIFYAPGFVSDESAIHSARLYGASSFNDGGAVAMFGLNHPTYPGRFILYARKDSDNFYTLYGNPDNGLLYWDGSPVLNTQSDLAASKITGSVPIANGGTGATTRLAAAKNLLNENVGTGANYFLTMTNSFANMGYSSIANAKTMLGLKSAAYTESSAYAAASHTHSYLPLSGGTMTNDITFAESGGIKGGAAHGLPFVAGSDTASSPYIIIHGLSDPETNYRGIITLHAGGLNGPSLVLNPNGNITWNGRHVVLDASISDKSSTANKSLAASTATNIVSISLTAGNYIVTAHARFESATTGKCYGITISDTSASFNTNANPTVYVGANGTPLALNTTKIFSLSSATTIYLVAQANAAATVTSGAIIRAIKFG